MLVRLVAIYAAFPLAYICFLIKLELGRFRCLEIRLTRDGDGSRTFRADSRPSFHSNPIALRPPPSPGDGPAGPETVDRRGDAWGAKTRAFQTVQIAPSQRRIL